jgi:putative oxidoreductase
VRRLFSTFARGWPGVGLFLMRIVAGGSLLINGVEKIQSGQGADSSTIVGLFAIADVALLVAGLWTPVAGCLVIVICAFEILVQHDNLCPGILLGAIGAALALVGPGALSMDARIFGWKRIDIEK